MTTMITTIDNPYDPFTDYDSWYAFDEQQGYHTCSYLARIAQVSPIQTPKEEDTAIELAIDEIIEEDPFGIYIKLTDKDHKVINMQDKI